MATGLAMYEALKQATRIGDEVTINILDSYDLKKLTPKDLISIDYDEPIADEVSYALLKNDFEPLARTMGLKTIMVSSDCASLLPEQNG